jgi:uncharacterized RDD family membrane protein YckC
MKPDWLSVAGGLAVIALGVAIPLGVHLASPTTSLGPLLGFGALVVLRGAVLLFRSRRRESPGSKPSARR